MSGSTYLVTRPATRSSSRPRAPPPPGRACRRRPTAASRRAASGAESCAAYPQYISGYPLSSAGLVMMVPREAHERDPGLMQRLWDLTHALNVRSKKMSRDLGVTGPQRIVIRAIGLMPGCSATEIAAALNMHPSTLTGILVPARPREADRARGQPRGSPALAPRAHREGQADRQGAQGHGRGRDPARPHACRRPRGRGNSPHARLDDRRARSRRLRQSLPCSDATLRNTACKPL